jgi:hypothetical protein
MTKVMIGRPFGGHLVASSRLSASHEQPVVPDQPRIQARVDACEAEKKGGRQEELTGCERSFLAHYERLLKVIEGELTVQTVDEDDRKARFSQKQFSQLFVPRLPGPRDLVPLANQRFANSAPRAQPGAFGE